MASNYKRRSSSSVSRRSASSTTPRSRTASSSSLEGASSRRQARRSSNEGFVGGSDSGLYISQRVEDVHKAQRASRLASTRRKWVARIVVMLVVVGALVVGGIALYVSPTFTIENVTIKGVEHLTQEEMLALADVPENTTLLRIDTAAVEQNCLRDAWIESVSVNRIFPNTLELDVTERTIAATVKVPTETSTVTRTWAIASDGTWLMPIPDKDSEAAATVSDQVYVDAENVLQIVDVPYGTTAEIGKTCTDDNVNNALAIVSGMTTELADRVVKVSATDAASTILTLDNGVEIAFGAAEDIRDKERVCLELLEEYEGTIAYINVRSVSSPTWRSI